MKTNFFALVASAFIWSGVSAQKPSDCPNLGVDLSKFEFLDVSTSDEDPMFLSLFYTFKEGNTVQLYQEYKQSGALVDASLYTFPLSAFAKLKREQFAVVVPFGDNPFDYAELTFNFSDEDGVTRLSHNCVATDVPYDPFTVNDLQFYLASQKGLDKFFHLVGK